MRNDQRAFWLKISLFAICILLAQPSIGQDEETAANAIDQYKEDSKQLVSFLKFSLNTLGNPEISARDKEVIINQSYSKIFRDQDVQIEDDLDDTREVVTNKDVQAYLKDVDFFFREVKFDFEILDIKDGLTEDGQMYIILEANRHLEGITVDGDTMNSVQSRFFELNVDEDNRDLKIVSIYTTKLSRTEELKAWWNRLSGPWKLIFGADVMINNEYYLYDVWEIGDTTVLLRGQEIPDTINIMSLMKGIVQKEEIDLSGTRRLQDLTPLNELTDLKKIDISNTDITDLFPIRSVTSIEILNCSGTKISNLDPIKYSRSLRELDISNTPVQNIIVLENFSGLEKLNLQNTVIDSLPPIKDLAQLRELNISSTNLERLDSVSYLKNLEHLNFSNTMVQDLGPISTLKKVKHLEFNQTKVSDIGPLAEMENLETLSFLSSPVVSLKPLINLKKLTRVYCDDTKVSKDEFVSFYRERPDIKVIFSTEQLQKYFDDLDENWKKIIVEAAHISNEPEKEDLHEILKIKSIDIQNNIEITNLEPLSMLVDLRYLNFSNTNVSDISPVSQQLALDLISGSGTEVTDISSLSKLINLRIVRFNESNISDISPLANCRSLDSLYFEKTNVSDIRVLNELPSFDAAYFDGAKVTDTEFVMLNYHQDSAVVIYRSDYLSNWWGSMPDAWQDLLIEKFDVGKRPDIEKLHILAGRTSLKLEGLSLTHLDPITAFVRLEELEFYDTRISDLSSLASLEKLKILKCPRNPVSSLLPLGQHDGIEVLEVQNTQIGELLPITGMTALKTLNCSGTPVKDLKPISTLQSLEDLDFSNTNVKNIKPLEGLPNLKVLKCYNNKISAKRVEELRRKFPEADIVFY